MAISKSAKGPIMMPLAQKDVVVETVRAAILSGAMPPGTQFNLDVIASQHGTSRMPVRDALHQLKTEGLITIYPRRGAQVAQLDVSDMEELFGIRTVLEQKALELAIPRLTQEQFDEMHTLLKRMDWISGRGKAWIGANERFHSILNEASGWPRLISMIKVLRRNIERYIRIHLVSAAPVLLKSSIGTFTGRVRRATSSAPKSSLLNTRAPPRCNSWPHFVPPKLVGARRK